MVFQICIAVATNILRRNYYRNMEMKNHFNRQPAKPNIFRLGLFCLLLVLAAAVNAQTNQQVITVKNIYGEDAFGFTANTSDPSMRRLPDRIMSKKQSDVPEFVRLLAEYINENSSNDYERVKKAHDWVALNIRYDTQSFFSGRYSSQTFDAVIKRGSGVCAGYADVFKYLCDAIGLECIIVNGYARGYNSDIFKTENVTKTNHAWNIVSINDSKYLIDCTWDAGHVTGRNFVANYRTCYLFADPGIFIYDHFSYSSSTQLLDPMITAEEFEALPFLEPEFFETFETWPILSKITEVIIGESRAFEFTVKDGYLISYTWYTSAGVKNGNSMFPTSTSVRITMPNLRPGNYFLRISVKKPGDRLYWSYAEFGFTVKN